MKTNRGIRIIVGAATLFLLMVCFIPGALSENKPIILKFAFGYSKPNPAAYVYESFAKGVNERAKGRLSIELYEGGALGGEGSAVQAVMGGNADIFAISNDNFSAFDRGFFFCSLPYMFNSQEHAMQVLRGSIGQTAKQRAEKNLGIRILFTPIVSFFRTLSNSKHEVKTPADCKGLKIRATSSAVEVAFLKNLGILPTPISWGELYTALKQGVVDGTHNQYLWTYFGKLHESIKYITELKAMGVHQVIGMRSDMFDKLDEELQGIILQESLKAEDYALQLGAQKDEEAKNAMIKSGVKIYIPTEAELEQFKEKAKPIWKEYSKDVSMETIKKIHEIGQGL